jgi:hypothetical protein
MPRPEEPVAQRRGALRDAVSCRMSESSRALSVAAEPRGRPDAAMRGWSPACNAGATPVAALASGHAGEH